MVKVLHVITDPRLWRLFFAGQPEYLRTKHFEFHAMSSPGPDLATFCADSGAVPHDFEISRTISPQRDLVCAVRLWKQLRRIKPDIMVAHFTKPGLVGMVAAFFARVPARIYQNHGMALCSTRGLKRFLLFMAERVACYFATKVVYVSPSVRRAAIEQGVCPPEKATSILSINGLNAEHWFRAAADEVGRTRAREALAVPAGGKVLGFVGRLLALKGIVELLGAWRTLRTKYPDLYLVMVGDFDSRDPLPIDSVREIKRDPRIRLTGFVSEVRPFYCAFDVMILPSHHEGLPCSLLEGSAMERPVIGTRIPGIVDAIVEGKTGTIIAPHDPDAIVLAVSMYIDHPELGERHGKAGRQYVQEKFAQMRVWNETYALYQSLLERPSKRNPSAARFAKAHRDG